MDNVKRLHGTYRAVVHDNKDPQHLNRLRLKVQTTGFGSDAVTDWVWPVNHSSLSVEVPPVGQGVWVTYAAGDPEYPVWHGTFGKHQGNSKKVLIKHLPNSTSLSGISDQIVLVKNPDGTQEVDLVASLLAMAAKIKDHETRIHTLETTPDIDPR